MLQAFEQSPSQVLDLFGYSVLHGTGPVLCRLLQDRLHFVSWDDPKTLPAVVLALQHCPLPLSLDVSLCQLDTPTLCTLLKAMARSTNRDLQLCLWSYSISQPECEVFRRLLKSKPPGDDLPTVLKAIDVCPLIQ